MVSGGLLSIRMVFLLASSGGGEEDLLLPGPKETVDLLLVWKVFIRRPLDMGSSLFLTEVILPTRP